MWLKFVLALASEELRIVCLKCNGKGWPIVTNNNNILHLERSPKALKVCTYSISALFKKMTSNSRQHEMLY